MLTLNPDSVCDVCADEYGPFNLPRCIPCGHVLCESCATTIVQKTSPRLQPACPFCREPFQTDGIRVIRIDFSRSSGGGSSGPSAATVHSVDTAPPADGFGDEETILLDLRRPRSASTSRHASRDHSRAASRERGGGYFTTIDEDHHLPHAAPPAVDMTHFDPGRHRERAVELEKKVAKVAAKRCSVEEVHALQRELAEWLAVDKTAGSMDVQQHTALQLSHLLLRAILMNHLAHSEATKVAKGVESQLRARLADGDLIREKLDGELRKHKTLLSSKTAEVMNLRAEFNRAKGGPGNGGTSGSGNGGASTPTRRSSISSASAPTSPDGYFAFSSASTASHAHAVSPPSSASSSGRTTPTAGLSLSGQLSPLNFPVSSPNGASRTSSASAAAAALQHPTSPSPGAGGRYHHTRTTSLMHRPTTPGALQHPSTASISSHSASRRSMTPGPALGHMRSASVAPGASSGIPPVPTLHRSMTPGIHSHSRSHASSAHSMSQSQSQSQAAGHPNGPSAGASPLGPGAGAGAGAVPVPVSALSHSMNSGFASSNSTANTSGSSRDSAVYAGVSTSPGAPRPPVPPKPRTLSQSTGAALASAANGHSHGQGHGHGNGRRGVVDDRDGYLSERPAEGAKEPVREKEKERKKEKEGGRGRHERWLPSALMDRMTRPATSLS